MLCVYSCQIGLLLDAVACQIQFLKTEIPLFSYQHYTGVEASKSAVES